MRTSGWASFFTQGRSAVNKLASYGLIVEGPYDELFYEALIPRICGTDPSFVTRVCDGLQGLMKNFPAFLRNLENVLQGRPVDKALVIRDSDRKDPLAARAEMARRIEKKEYAFPHGVQLCVVRRAIETWLLADINAVNTVALDRGGRRVGDVKGNIEDIRHPKTLLRSRLSTARIVYTGPVCSEIARNLRIEILEYRCASFRTFKQSVLDC